MRYKIIGVMVATLILFFGCGGESANSQAEAEAAAQHEAEAEAMAQDEEEAAAEEAVEAYGEEQEATAAAEGEMVMISVPLGTLWIAPPEDREDRAPVEFPHGQHFDFHCTDCHHTWNGETPIMGCRTSGCHDLQKAPENPLQRGEYTAEGIRYFKYAYHESCIGCHKAVKKGNIDEATRYRLSDQNTKIMKTGPIGCGKCHPRSAEGEEY